MIPLLLSPLPADPRPPQCTARPVWRRRWPGGCHAVPAGAGHWSCSSRSGWDWPPPDNRRSRAAEAPDNARSLTRPCHSVVEDIPALRERVPKPALGDTSLTPDDQCRLRRHLTVIPASPRQMGMSTRGLHTSDSDVDAQPTAAAKPGMRRKLRRWMPGPPIIERSTVDGRFLHRTPESARRRAERREASVVDAVCEPRADLA